MDGKRLLFSDHPGYTTSTQIVGTGPDTDAIESDAVQLFQVGDDAKLVLEGVTLRGGNSTNGGAGSIGKNAALSLKNVVLDSNTAQTSGGALFLDANSTTVIQQSVFKNNVAMAPGVGPDGGGALFVSTGASVQIASTTFSQCAADRGSVMKINEETHVNVWNTQFDGNHGGAINTADNAKIQLVECMLVNNTAAASGGALAPGSGSQYNITACTFDGNTAPRGGAAALNGCELNLVDTSFVGNRAKLEGGAIIMQGTCSGTSTRTTFSGNSATEGAAIYAFENQKYQVSSGTLFQGNTASGAGAGILQKGADFTLTVSDDATFSENTAGCCFIGGYGSRELATGGGSCVDIDTSATSTYIEGNLCLTCDPDRVECLEPGITTATLPLLPGYWRASLEVGQADILRCWNEKACRGGAAKLSTDDYCDDGYEGPYCAVCRAGYTSFVGSTCYKCQSGAVVSFAVFSTLVVVAMIVVCGALAAMGAHRPGSVSEVYKEGSRNTGVADATASVYLGLTSTNVKGAVMSVLRAMRIPIVVMQILTQYLSITGVPIPALYRTFISWLDLINLDMSVVLSPGCVFDVNFYQKLLLSTITPLCILALLGLAYVVASRHANRSGRWGQRIYHLFVDKAGLLVLSFTFLIFSATSTVIFQTFACDAIPGFNGKRFLRADYAIECDTATYDAYRIYAAIMVLVYPVGIPALYMAALWWQRSAIKEVPEAADGEDAEVADNVHLASLGFLWQPYRRQFWYWEVVECGRRLLLSGGLVFILPGSFGQSVYACIFAYFSILVYLRCGPHNCKLDATLYSLGATILFLTMFVALVAQYGSLDVDEKDANIISVMLIALNLVLLGTALAQACVVGRYITRASSKRTPPADTDSELANAPHLEKRAPSIREVWRRNSRTAREGPRTSTFASLLSSASTRLGASVGGSESVEAVAPPYDRRQSRDSGGGGGAASAYTPALELVPVS
ncbi:pectin lyase fold/virulence factor [Tribonema minus]|uniref:Pectin lyase fold/virulence factor n=1 Tax=Tribonema minus TaxID=303371 RepID=A0A835YLB8_9STRA|nr:pectin lyase fold/virulence factor [Tribonema minus]